MLACYGIADCRASSSAHRITYNIYLNIYIYIYYLKKSIKTLAYRYYLRKAYCDIMYHDIDIISLYHPALQWIKKIYYVVSQ